MKKILILSILCTLTWTQLVYAHPPTKIETAFDHNSKVLYATITHPVDDPVDHFIKKVRIMLNGQEIIRHKISKQDNALIQAVSYMIPDVQSGDEVSIEAYCSIDGTWTEKIQLK